MTTDLSRKLDIISKKTTQLINNYKTNIQSGGKSIGITRNKPLIKITHPIDGPKKITIVLKPFLVYNGSTFLDTYLTGNSKIDSIITKRIEVDYTRLQNILPYYYEIPFHTYGTGLEENELLEKNVEIKCIDYEFKNGLIYMTVKKSNDNGFSKNDRKAIKICFDPYDFGPDNYMLQDIIIYQGNNLKPIIKEIEKKYSPLFKFSDDENTDLVLELAVEVVNILWDGKK